MGATFPCANSMDAEKSAVSKYTRMFVIAPKLAPVDRKWAREKGEKNSVRDEQADEMGEARHAGHKHVRTQDSS